MAKWQREVELKSVVKLLLWRTPHCHANHANFTPIGFFSYKIAVLVKLNPWLDPQNPTASALHFNFRLLLVGWCSNFKSNLLSVASWAGRCRPGASFVASCAQTESIFRNCFFFPQKLSLVTNIFWFIERRVGPARMSWHARHHGTSNFGYGRDSYFLNLNFFNSNSWWFLAGGLWLLSVEDQPFLCIWTSMVKIRATSSQILRRIFHSVLFPPNESFVWLHDSIT